MSKKKKKFNNLDYVVMYLLALYLMPVPQVLMTIFTDGFNERMKHVLLPIAFFALYIPIWYAIVKFKIVKK